MEIKNNDATELRPEGERILDAPLVSIALPEFIKQIKAESTWQSSDRNAITVYKTNGLRIVLVALKQHAEMKKHKAEGILSFQVIEGEVSFSTDNETKNLQPGDMIALHEGLHHSVQAVKESVFLLTLTTTLEK